MELGQEVRVGVGPLRKRPGKIVWVQEEPDGAIIGVAFHEDGLGSSPSIQLTAEQLAHAQRVVLGQIEADAPAKVDAVDPSKDDRDGGKT